MCSLSGSGGAAPSPRQTTTTLHKSDSSLESTSGGMPSPELLQTVWFCEYFCVSHVHVSPTCWCVQKRLCFRPNSSPHCPNCRVGSTVHLHGEHVVPGSHAPLGNDPCAPWTFSFFLSFFLSFCCVWSDSTRATPRTRIRLITNAGVAPNMIQQGGPTFMFVAGRVRFHCLHCICLMLFEQ